MEALKDDPQVIMETWTSYESFDECVVGDFMRKQQNHPHKKKGRTIIQEQGVGLEISFFYFSFIFFQILRVCFFEISQAWAPK